MNITIDPGFLALIPLWAWVLYALGAWAVFMIVAATTDTSIAVLVAVGWPLISALALALVIGSWIRAALNAAINGKGEKP